MDLLKLVQAPNLKHEIIMKNGTVIQGTIIFETTDQMIIKTRIGQLTIEKGLDKGSDACIASVDIKQFYDSINIYLYKKL